MESISADNLYGILFYGLICDVEEKNVNDLTFYQRRTGTRTQNSKFQIKQNWTNKCVFHVPLFSKTRFLSAQIPFRMAGILIDFIFKALFNAVFDVHRYGEGMQNVYTTSV